ncbi:uncharacterized protein LOC111673517 [Scomber scombrus]|uniref:Uncharacterized protein LOC111673517 n=1 Tax=Scomber scombrus TaxID=13677 RepID=A0AAV1PDJ4_SCOSC
MAKPVRPASENYQPAYCSVSQSFSYSSAAGTEGLEDEDDKAPIFSLSKSSMDVVMATGPPHKRDPAWTRMDMRRSSSTNTHSEQHPHMLQEINNVQAPLTAQHLDTHGRAISDRWLANLERWSGCSSSSTHSRSSTPDTVLCERSFTSSEGITHTRRVEVFREEGTMTSQLELVDAAVQTVSPANSLWDLRSNISSNMGSHSILGSPPGSRLNLKSSVGSHSNLVSPSSSMFPVSSGEEEERQGDDPMWDVNSASSNDLERRRSCLKIHDREELGRRSSMKQVQWDEDGMTWDVHGASLDPEVLSTAIRKHLELKYSPQPPRRSSKKKKAPKPPLISNVVKAMTPELNPPVMIITSTCLAERESKETLGADEGKEAEEEGERKKEETVEDARTTSGTEGDNAKEKEEEVYGEEGPPKSPSRGSVVKRKRSVIRSLKRPGWCGSSRNTDD